MNACDPTSDTIRTGVIATRCFTPADQEAFAVMSGDRNPMHMDPLAARRTQAGAPVVHGIHALLWVLDSIAAAGVALNGVRQMKVQFEKFMYVGRTLSVRFEQSDPAAARATVLVDELPAMIAVLRFGDRAIKPAPAAASAVASADAPDVLELAQMTDLSGWLTPPVGAAAFAAAFPSAARTLDARRLSGLAQTSRLVGMVCPGLHSIYAGLTLDLTDEIAAPEGIGFRTTRADERFRRVDMAVAGDGLSGQISTFARRPPVEAPTMAELSGQVAPGEFAGSSALVVGGSRGLGAIIAKLLAAGGARVIVTYARGRAEAESLCAEINTACSGEVCSVLALDAMQPVAPQLGALKATHLYYCATPRIFVQKSAVFVPSLYAEFSRVYVDAFYESCMAVMEGTLSVLYPSSVAVAARPEGMTEYSMAKAAGEMLCADMQVSVPGLRILVDRLPRILTDQTATVATAESADPIEVMLPLVRAVQGAIT